MCGILYILPFLYTARAGFASCPQEYSGCSKEVPLSVTLGDPAIFDASITYTPGGSCDFKQAINRVAFTKINGKSNLPNTLLFTCRTDQGASCLINDNRLSLSRGDGLDYNFILSNATQEDAGVYEVVVEGTHPAIGSLITFKRNFHLNIIGIQKLLYCDSSYNIISAIHACTRIDS